MEPSRRLSETTDPRSSSAFRVVVRPWRQQNAARSANGGRQSSHMAHRSRRDYPDSTGAAAHVPRSRWTPRACYPSASVLDESGAVQGDSVLLTRYRKRRRGRRTRYRSVSRADAVTVAQAVAIRGGDGGTCTAAGSGAQHHAALVRQQCRQWARQQCWRPCAGPGAVVGALVRGAARRVCAYGNGSRRRRSDDVALEVLRIRRRSA